MYKYFLIYNDKTNIDLKTYIETRPSKPSPIMEYEEVKVPGGKTLYREKGYSDIEITVSFNFLSKKPTQWDENFRNIKKWLLGNENNKLKFCDDLEVFYRVNKVIIDTPERILRQYGKFTVTFTCEPYVYIEESELELSERLYNNYLSCRPIYRIIGNGQLNLTVNNNLIKVNVGQELIIDTDKGLYYRDGIINNVALTGRYEDMYLLEGENTFSWDNNFKVYITPNWRCL